MGNGGTVLETPDGNIEELKEECLLPHLCLGHIRSTDIVTGSRYRITDVCLPKFLLGVSYFFRL